jgi:hypothetical protein
MPISPDFSGLHRNRFFAVAESEGFLNFTEAEQRAAGFADFAGGMLPLGGVNRVKAFIGLHPHISKASRGRLAKLGLKHGFERPEHLIGEFISNAWSSGGSAMSSEGKILDGPYKTHLTGAYKQARLGMDWKKVTGLSPIFIGAKGKMSATVLNHEEIHVAHIGNKNHPFFKGLEKSAPSFEDAYLSANVNEDTIGKLKASYQRENQKVLRAYGINNEDTYINSRLQTAAQQQKTSYQATWDGMRKYGASGREQSDIGEATERIAYAYQSNPRLLEEAEKLGIKTRRSEATRLKQVAKAAMEAGEGSRPVGWLSDAVSGARKMSKAL